MANIETLMKNLDLTRAEAEQLMADDKEVDRMTSMKDVNSDMSKEQQKVAKKARQADRQPTAYKFTKRERKADNEKAELIKQIAEIFGESAEITNKEREISLIIGENHYSITLTKHRKPKK